MGSAWDGVPTFETEQARIRELVAASPKVKACLIDGHRGYEKLLSEYHADCTRFEQELSLRAEHVLASGHVWEPGIENAANRETYMWPVLWPTRLPTLSAPMAKNLPREPKDQRSFYLLRLANRSRAGIRGLTQKEEKRAASLGLRFLRAFTGARSKSPTNTSRVSPSTVNQIEQIEAKSAVVSTLCVHVIAPRPRPANPRTNDPLEFRRLSERAQFTIMGYWLCALHDYRATIPLVGDRRGGSPFEGADLSEWLGPEYWPLQAKAWAEWITVLQNLADKDVSSGHRGGDDGKSDSNAPPRKPGGWTKKELGEEADVSGSTFDRIRRATSVKPSERGGKGTQRRFSVAELRKLIAAVQAGTYRNQSDIVRAWRDLLPQ